MLVSEQFLFWLYLKNWVGATLFEVFAPQNGLNWVNLGPKQLWQVDGQAYGDLDGEDDEDEDGDESNDNDIENTDLVNGTWPDYLGGDDEVSRRPAVYPLLPLVVFFLLENIVGNFIVLGWWFRELGYFVK